MGYRRWLLRTTPHQPPRRLCSSYHIQHLSHPTPAHLIQRALPPTTPPTPHTLPRLAHYPTHHAIPHHTTPLYSTPRHSPRPPTHPPAQPPPQKMWREKVNIASTRGESHPPARLLGASMQLDNSYYLLPTTHYLLLTTYYRLPTTYY